jgi:hypothetical protein
MFGREGLGREPAGLLRWARVQRGSPPRYGGGPRGGSGTPGEARAGRPGPRPPEPSGARAPLPHPPEGKGGVGLPLPGPGGPGQALFSCLLFQFRAPHPKLREFGDSPGS